MRELRFAPWYKHERVVLDKKDGESWLVGKGPWSLVDVFSKQDEAWLPSNYELSKGFRTAPSTRTVTNAEGEQTVVPLSRPRMAFAFASIETPEQALEFANRFGLLGLHTAPADRCNIQFPEDQEIWERWKEGKGTLPWRISSIPKPGSDSETIPRSKAGDALRLSGPDLRKAFAFIASAAPAQILFPEKVDEWLEIAATLRFSFERFGRRKAETPPEDAKTMRALTREEILRHLAIDEWTQGQLRVEDGELVIKYSSLRDAIFLQAALEMNNLGQPARQCDNPNCRRWFAPTIKNAKYCTVECKRRCQNQRYYKRVSRRHKMAEARQEGK